VQEIIMTFSTRHISVSINRPAAEVYDFVSNPENLPQWAAGLSDSIRKVGDDWIAESPMGTVKVKFAAQNTFGVLDHDVTLPSGVTFHNPMRVIPNDDGCEIMFTVYHRADVSDEAFMADTTAVENDLRRLKSILEK
jgi:uncharacterized protein YndB with AHSA1/START domain